MLKEFTDNTTKTAKEAGSVEGLMRTAWAEIVDTQQINADKTWHYVTKQAILNHIKDMAKRTKSTVTIVVPNIEEAPIKEIKEISKAIRINVIAGIDETFHKKLLKELFSQGNVRLWSLTEKDYISCTRDAEEVLIAPAARKDTDCVATVSTEENYVKLYHKFIGPMWMASSREIKERTLV
jgi:predicted DNA-binding ribbon-helix-helix protein